MIKYSNKVDTHSKSDFLGSFPGVSVTFLRPGFLPRFFFSSTFFSTTCSIPSELNIESSFICSSGRFRTFCCFLVKRTAVLK